MLPSSLPRVTFFVGLLAMLLPTFSACAGAPEAAEPTADDVVEREETLSSATPIPYALQFSATYVVDAAATGDVASVDLARDGRYTIVFKNHTTPREHGSWHGAPVPQQFPYTIRLATRGRVSPFKIAAYDGAATVTRNGISTMLHATARVGPSEELCDASGGSWTDDDVDRSTGLYCVCPSGRVYLPSHGGCVR
jgi:hypothetical protein